MSHSSPPRRSSDLVAEELLGSKAFYVRDGLLKDVDVAVFAHVSPTFNTAWGDLGSTGMVSVEYRFTGRTAHAAMDPWEGRSALDAVEVRSAAWNLRRVHQIGRATGRGGVGQYV